VREELEEIYKRLYAYFGPQHWWPSESRWEIMVGAVLTQNTSWRNAALAIANLKRAGRLDPERMRRMRHPTLSELLRPSGYYKTKAKKLQALVGFLFQRYGGDPTNLLGGELATQRKELLAVYGIGPETADAILLYVAEQPIFVIDAYTRRICARLGLIRPDATYADVQKLFMENLSHDVALFNEYHALLDVHAKNICTKRAPRCTVCPLNDICPKIGVQ
jgi:endonuclease-3 related protein